MRTVVITLVLCSMVCGRESYAMHRRERGKNKFLEKIVALGHRLPLPPALNRASVAQHEEIDGAANLANMGERRNSVYIDLENVTTECLRISFSADQSEYVPGMAQQNAGTSCDDQELSEERKFELTCAIKTILDAKPPKEYINAIRGVNRRSSRRKSINTFEKFIFDPKQYTWVHSGSLAELASIFTQDGQGNSARYNRIFCYVHGENQQYKDFIETFYLLYNRYIYIFPNLKDPIVAALARYRAAKVIGDLKEHRPDICDENEFARIEQARKESRAVLESAHIVEPEEKERVQEIFEPKLSACVDENF